MHCFFYFISDVFFNLYVDFKNKLPLLQESRLDPPGEPIGCPGFIRSPGLFSHHPCSNLAAESGGENTK